MRIFILLLFVIVSESMLAQKRLIRNSSQLIYNFDSNVFHIVQAKRKSIFWNNKAIDSTGLRTSSLTTDGRSILFSYWAPPKYYFYTVDSSGKLKKLFESEKKFFFLTGGRLFGTERLLRMNEDGEEKAVNGKNILEYNIETGVPVIFCKLDSLFDVNDVSQLIGLTEIGNGSYLASLCDLTIECLYCRYVLISASGRVIKEIKFESLARSDTYQLSVIDQDHDSVLVEVSGGTQEENGHFIYNKDFQPITRCLEANRRKAGLNFKAGRFESRNIFSHVDDGTEVILLYKYSIYVERSFYHIYAGKLLLVGDLAQCTPHELDLIQTMVSAKYNNKFQDEYYQAYFNSYIFYGSKVSRESRIEDVSNLLTDIDKSNLKLIETYAGKK